MVTFLMKTINFVGFCRKARVPRRGGGPPLCVGSACSPPASARLRLAPRSTRLRLASRWEIKRVCFGRDTFSQRACSSSKILLNRACFVDPGPAALSTPPGRDFRSLRSLDENFLVVWLAWSGVLVQGLFIMCTYGVLCECIIYKQDSVCRRRPTMARRCLCGAA